MSVMNEETGHSIAHSGLRIYTCYLSADYLAMFQLFRVMNIRE